MYTKRQTIIRKIIIEHVYYTQKWEWHFSVSINILTLQLNVWCIICYCTSPMSCSNTLLIGTIIFKLSKITNYLIYFPSKLRNNCREKLKRQMHIVAILPHFILRKHRKLNDYHIKNYFFSRPPNPFNY